MKEKRNPSNIHGILKGIVKLHIHRAASFYWNENWVGTGNLNVKWIFGKQFDSISLEKARLETKTGWNSPGKIGKKDRKKNRFKQWGLMCSLRILGLMFGLWDIPMQTPISGHFGEIAPRFALDRCLGGRFKFDPKIFSVCSISSYFGD